MKLKVYVSLFISVLLPIQLIYAQYLSVKGDFEVDQIRGCTGLAINVTNITPGSGSILYQFEGSASPPTNNTTYTYSSVGDFWLYQTITESNGGSKQDSIFIRILTPEPIDVELLSCNNFQLMIQINDSFYDEYEINYGNGSVATYPVATNIPTYTYATGNQQLVLVTGLFTTANNRCAVTTNTYTPNKTVLPAQIDSLITINSTSLKLDYILPQHSINKLEVSFNNNTNYVLLKNLSQKSIVDTIVNLITSQNTYCFRIATYDACSNFKSYSNEICSVSLKALAENNQNAINWTTLDLGGGQQTNIYRNGSRLQTYPSVTNSHIDNLVVCKIEYCYQAQVLFSGGGIANSLQDCQTSFSNDIPPTIENSSSIVASDSITWIWEIPLGILPPHYMFYTVNGSGNIIDSDTAFSNFYKTIYANDIQYAAIELHDLCDNASPISAVASSIYLQAKIDESTNIDLQWNTNLGWIDGIHEYILTIKDEDGTMLDSLSTGFSTNFTLDINNQAVPILNFEVWAIAVKHGIKHSKSNSLRVESPVIISIPNGFTPNEDGLNDTFNVSGKFIDSFEMFIFNRWGEILFSSDEVENGWDGTIKGKKVAVGNYAYWIRIKDLNDNEHIRTGSILILSN